MLDSGMWILAIFIKNYYSKSVNDHQLFEWQTVLSSTVCGQLSYVKKFVVRL